LLGQGGWAFGFLVDALVGSDVGFLVGVGSAVGLAVGFAVGLAVGFAVALAVGCGVGWAVRTGVGAAVGLGVGPRVADGWLGRGEGFALGPVVGVAGAAGEALATAIVGLALAIGADGLAIGDVVGDPLGDAVGSPLGDASLPGEAGEPAVGAGLGAGVDTTAIGLLLSFARCWSSTPPRPSAIVARTRFRTPRLRMRRAR
jgi:hypothetical protein